MLVSSFNTMKIKLSNPYIIYEKGKGRILEDFIYPIENNEEEASPLYLICDGKGGAGKGDVAARLVGESFIDYIYLINPLKNKQIGQVYFNEALRYVERKMQKYTVAHPESSGMSSTALLLHYNYDATASVAWVGNSRLYHFNNKGQILYKTDDHLEHHSFNGKLSASSRVISGIEMVWGSTQLITDIQAGDYFMLCSAGVNQILQDRNLKYIMSQAGNNGVNLAAVSQKIREICAENAQENYSVCLFQVLDAPLSPIAKNRQAVGEQDVKAVPFQKKALTSQDKKTENKPIKSNHDFSAIKKSKGSKTALALFTLILLATALAITFKYLTAKPEELFNKYYLQGKTYLQEGNYEEAIVELEKAINVNLKDTITLNQAQQLLNKTKEEYNLYKAKLTLGQKDWVKAREEFFAFLQTSPNNPEAQKILEDIQLKLSQQKDSLVQVSNVLINEKNYPQAKSNLFEALYIDQKDEQLVWLLNVCNQYLKQDTLTLKDAVNQAIWLQSNSEKTPEVAALTEEVTEKIIENQQPTTPVPTPAIIKTPELPVVKPLPIKTDEAQKQFEQLLSDANKAFENEDYKTAKQIYEKCNGVKPSDAITEKINKCDLMAKKQAFLNLVSSGDKEFEAQNYSVAQKHYEQALTYQPDDSYVKQRINGINEVTQYATLIKRADEAFNNDDFQTAWDRYEAALKLTNDKSYAKGRIAQCMQKIQDLQGDASGRQIKKADKFCKSKGYNSECYTYLKENNLFYNIDPIILLEMGKNFEKTGNKEKARECYGTAAAKGISEAAERKSKLDN